MQEATETTISIRELKSKASRILRTLEESTDREVVITRHGKPCAKLVSLSRKPGEIPWTERISLRGTWANLHELSDADFAEAKRIWEPKTNA